MPWQYKPDQLSDIGTFFAAIATIFSIIGGGSVWIYTEFFSRSGQELTNLAHQLNSLGIEKSEIEKNLSEQEARNREFVTALATANERISELQLSLGASQDNIKFYRNIVDDINGFNHKELIDNAEEFYSKGNFEDADKIVQSIYESYPIKLENSYRIFGLRGRIRLASGELKDAAKWFQHAAALPVADNAGYGIWSANIYFNLGFYDIAEAAYRSSIELSEAHEGEGIARQAATLGLALVKFQQGDSGAAERILGDKIEYSISNSDSNYAFIMCTSALYKVKIAQGNNNIEILPGLINNTIACVKNSSNLELLYAFDCFLTIQEYLMESGQIEAAYKITEEFDKNFSSGEILVNRKQAYSHMLWANLLSYVSDERATLFYSRAIRYLDQIEANPVEIVLLNDLYATHLFAKNEPLAIIFLQRGVSTASQALHPAHELRKNMTLKLSEYYLSDRDCDGIKKMFRDSVFDPLQTSLLSSNVAEEIIIMRDKLQVLSSCSSQ